MLRTSILIIEAVLFVLMLFFVGRFLNGANTALLIALIFISLPSLEYFRRLLPKRVEKKSKAMRVREQELRQLFNNRIMKSRANSLSKEVTLINLSKKDGDTSEEKTSSQLEATLEQTYHSGIHIGLGTDTLIKSSFGYRLPNQEKNEEGEIEAMLMGEIPFDVIDRVNIEGDKHYPYPQIFCRFPFNGHPYERLFYAKTITMEDGRPWYKEVADYEVVKLNSKVEGEW